MASNNETLPFATLIHMVTIKLTSTNYLLWKNQLTPILACQDLLGFVDGSNPPPCTTILDSAGKSTQNPAYDRWRIQDQRLLSLLLSSLTEESMSEVLGCDSSRAVWLALESAFSHRSKSRELRLKDDLQLMKKGSRSVSEYGRQFKSLCDQLAAIGRPVDDTDKSHWFLRGLGSSFSNFSAAQMALTPLPTFRDLLSKAESLLYFRSPWSLLVLLMQLLLLNLVHIIMVDLLSPTVIETNRQALPNSIRLVVTRIVAAITKARAAAVRGDLHGAKFVVSRVTMLTNAPNDILTNHPILRIWLRHFRLAAPFLRLLPLTGISTQALLPT